MILSLTVSVGLTLTCLITYTLLQNHLNTWYHHGETRYTALAKACRVIGLLGMAAGFVFMICAFICTVPYWAMGLGLAAFLSLALAIGILSLIASYIMQLADAQLCQDLGASPEISWFPF